MRVPGQPPTPGSDVVGPKGCEGSKLGCSSVPVDTQGPSLWLIHALQGEGAGGEGGGGLNGLFTCTS